MDQNPTEPPYRQIPYEQQYHPSQPYPPPTQYGMPVPPPVAPPVYVVQQPRQSSTKTIWLVVGIILAVFLVVGGGCCAITSLGLFKSAQVISTAVQSSDLTLTADAQTEIADEASPEQQASDYYFAVEEQDYSGAYDYMVSTTTSLTSFMQQAQALDSSSGLVTSYTAVPDPSDPTHVTVNAVRQKAGSYTVHLTFVQDSYQWAINSFDTI